MSDKPTYSPNDKLTIKSDGIFPKTTVSIGDKMIPVRRMTVHFEPSEYVRVEMEVWAQHVDVTALTEHTRMVVEQLPNPSRLRRLLHALTSKFKR